MVIAFKGFLTAVMTAFILGLLCPTAALAVIPKEPSSK